MASIKGDISVMPLTDLLQWVDMCKKTGFINVNFYAIEKKIYSESIFDVFKYPEDITMGIREKT